MLRKRIAGLIIISLAFFFQIVVTIFLIKTVVEPMLWYGATFTEIMTISVIAVAPVSIVLAYMLDGLLILGFVLLIGVEN